MASDAGKSIYDNWAKPVTEMSYSPSHPKNKRIQKMELKKNSMHMDMFFPDQLIYEMKPIHEIQTKFHQFRK